MCRITDRAHHFCGDISLAADKINHLACYRVVKHSVNGEIAPLSVFLGRRKMHRAWVPAVDVRLIGTKGGHLKLKAVLEHDDHAKMCTDCVRAREKRLHSFRARVSGDIVILWDQTAHHVATAAACNGR